MSSSFLSLSLWGRQLTHHVDQLKKHVIDTVLTPPIPAEVFESAADCLVHVSDTPALTYSSLFRLLEKIKPNVLIHTGDLVDQLKLGNHSYLHSLYQEKVECFIRQLERMPVDTIYLVPGNHDDPDILTYTCQRSHVLSGSSLVNFGPFKLGVAHQPQDLPPGADFGLYGHSPDKPPANSGRPLSGLQSINVLLANGNIYSIPYPRGTDVARGIKIRPQKL